MSKIAVAKVRSDLEDEVEKLIGLVLGSDFLAIEADALVFPFALIPAYAGILKLDSANRGWMHGRSCRIALSLSIQH